MANEIIDTDKFIYYVPMPKGIHEAVVPCVNGYTIYICEDLTRKERLEAFAHAMKHIEGDFDDENAGTVQDIELKAHRSARDAAIRR